MNNTHLMWENPHTHQFPTYNKYSLHSPNQICYTMKNWEMQIKWKKRDKNNIYSFSYLTCAVNRILPTFILSLIFCYLPLLIKIFKLKVKYLSKKTRFKWFHCNHMINIHSIPSQFLLPSLLSQNTLHPQTKQ